MLYLVTLQSLHSESFYLKIFCHWQIVVIETDLFESPNKIHCFESPHADDSCCLKQCKGNENNKHVEHVYKPTANVFMKVESVE